MRERRERVRRRSRRRSGSPPRGGGGGSSGRGRRSNREEGADEDPCDDGDQSRVAGLGAVVEQQRPDTGAESHAGDETGEGQDAAEQPALEADSGERNDEDDDPDVDEVHSPPSLSLTQPSNTLVQADRATTFSAITG